MITQLVDQTPTTKKTKTAKAKATLPLTVTNVAVHTAITSRQRSVKRELIRSSSLRQDRRPRRRRQSDDVSSSRCPSTSAHSRASYAVHEKDVAFEALMSSSSHDDVMAKSSSAKRKKASKSKKSRAGGVSSPKSPAAVSESTASTQNSDVTTSQTTEGTVTTQTVKASSCCETTSQSTVNGRHDNDASSLQAAVKPEATSTPLKMADQETSKPTAARKLFAKDTENKRKTPNGHLSSAGAKGGVTPATKVKDSNSNKPLVLNGSTKLHQTNDSSSAKSPKKNKKSKLKKTPSKNVKCDDTPDSPAAARDTLNSAVVTDCASPWKEPLKFILRRSSSVTPSSRSPANQKAASTNAAAAAGTPMKDACNSKGKPTTLRRSKSFDESKASRTKQLKREKRRCSKSDSVSNIVENVAACFSLVEVNTKLMSSPGSLSLGGQGVPGTPRR